MKLRRRRESRSLKKKDQMRTLVESFRATTRLRLVHLIYLHKTLDNGQILLLQRRIGPC
jgi:hypothetical protein